MLISEHKAISQMMQDALAEAGKDFELAQARYDADIALAAAQSGCDGICDAGCKVGCPNVCASSCVSYDSQNS